MWYLNIAIGNPINHDLLFFEENITGDSIEDYINNKFKSADVSINDINPGDTVILEYTTKDYQTNTITGESVEIEEEFEKYYPLDTIEKYYKFKEENKGKIVKKAYNKPRDLKPSEIIFKLNGKNTNLFDTDSLRLRYKLNEFIELYDNLKKKLTGVELSNAAESLINSSDDFIILSNLAKSKNIGYLEFKKLEELLNA